MTFAQVRVEPTAATDEAEVCCCTRNTRTRLFEGADAILAQFDLIRALPLLGDRLAVAHRRVIVRKFASTQLGVCQRTVDGHLERA